jgi:hypothetical protein
MAGGERIMRWKKGKRNMTWGKWEMREECGEENLVGGDRWERGKGKRWDMMELSGRHMAEGGRWRKLDM